MSRISKFIKGIRPKVLASSLAAALVTAFAPIIYGLIQSSTVKVKPGELGLAALVGVLTFIAGWLKSEPQTGAVVTAEDLVDKVLAGLPKVSLTAAPPSVADLKDLVVAASKDAIAPVVTQAVAAEVAKRVAATAVRKVAPGSASASTVAAPVVGVVKTAGSVAAEATQTVAPVVTAVEAAVESAKA